MKVSRYEIVPSGPFWNLKVELASSPDETWTDIFLDGVTPKPAAIADMHPTFSSDCITFQVPSGQLSTAFAFIEDSIVYANRAYRSIGR